MIPRCLFVAAFAAATAPAFAGLNPTFTWVQVNNTIGGPELDPLNGAAWVVQPWATFDLIMTGDFVANGVNLGSAPGEEHLGLNFNAAVYNATLPLSSDVETVLQNTFAGFLYDSYVDFGSNNAGGAANSQLITIGLNGLNPVDGVLRGAWAHNPPNGGTPQDASNGIRLLRISVDATAIGDPSMGTGFIQVGTADGEFTVFVTTIPAPCATGVLALGGLAALRRRR